MPAAFPLGSCRSMPASPEPADRAPGAVAVRPVMAVDRQGKTAEQFLSEQREQALRGQA